MNSELYTDLIEEFLDAPVPDIAVSTTMSPHGKIREFQTLDLSVPRRTGKTTALLQAFNNSQGSTFLVFRTLHQRFHHVGSKLAPRILTIEQLLDENWWRGHQLPDNPVFLLDEANRTNIDRLINLLVAHRHTTSKLVCLSTRWQPVASH